MTTPLHVACGNRREAVCPSCSAIYKRDARQLVRARLTGGKGIPETIAAHLCVFATLTAPSFGPVHPAVSAAERCCPAVRAVTATGGCARIPATSPARSATARMIRDLAARCAPPATTTEPRYCSTR